MVQWREITTLDESATIIEQSEKLPVLLLKHSTACLISAAAWQECLTFVENNPNKHLSYVVLKVIESRSVSNQIAEQLNIKHESPQLILIKNQEAVWNTSHWSITNENMKNALAKYL